MDMTHDKRKAAPGVPDNALSMLTDLQKIALRRIETVPYTNLTLPTKRRV